MYKSPEKYKNQLNELEDKINILLQRYNKSYTLYKSNPNINEYESVYNNDVQQIQNIFDEIFVLENNILKDSENNSSKLEDVNKNIEFSKEKYNLLKNNVNSNGGINDNDSGKTREKDTHYELSLEYYKLAFHIILLLGITYMLKTMLYE